MMRPPSRSRLAASRSVLNVPFRLIAIWLSNSASSVSAIASQLHDAGIVDQHVDAAERRLGRVEHARDRLRVADVGLGGDGAAAGLLDLADQRLGFGCAAGVIDDDGEAVGGEPLGDGGADAARSAGDERDLVGAGVHFDLLHLPTPGIELMGRRYAFDVSR